MLIAASDQDKLRARFADELSGSVTLRLEKHAGDCPLCARADALLTEMSALSDRLTLTTESGPDPCPEIRLEGEERRGQVRFVGLPSGYEFPAFIDSLVDVSRGTTSLSSDTVTRLRTLRRRVHLQVFTTPT